MFPSFIEESLGKITFCPSSQYPNALTFLDIVHDNVTKKPLVEEGSLDDDTIQTWLEKHHNGLDGKTSRLRLIFIGHPENAYTFDKFACSKNTFHSIVDNFELSRLYLTCFSIRTPHYLCQQSYNAHGDTLFSCVSRTTSFSKGGHAMTLTYNLTKNTTSVFLQGPLDQEYVTRMIRYLRDHLDMANQPAFVLLVITQLEYETLNREFDEKREKMISIEEQTGHSSIFLSREANRSFTQSGLLDLTKLINKFSSHMMVQVERVKSFLIHCESITKFIDMTSSYISEVDRRAPQQLVELKQHAEYMANGCKCLLQRYETFEKSVQVQIAVIYNISMQKDNKLNRKVAEYSADIAVASKRDSSAMKSISLLTMFFLPGTFVSTLFAMPLFDWSAGSVSAIATRHAWIYVAVTLPLTIFVLIIWSLWVWLSHLRRARRVQNQEFDEDEIELDKMEASSR